MSLGLDDPQILLRYVQVDCLSGSGIELLVQALGDSICDRLLWDSLCHRLVLVRLKSGDEIEIPCVTPKSQKSQDKVEIPMKAAELQGGIISYLTRKHGGNVHEKGIVTITSRSVRDRRFAVMNVADLTSHSGFESGNAPGQWVCWDFREMRVRLSQCTISAYALKSWVIEGSLDGTRWTVIDQQTDNQNFKRRETASFALSNPTPFRFVRLTQTTENHCPFRPTNYTLCLYAVEFFGPIAE
jgi:hypothetical protein